MTMDDLPKVKIVGKEEGVHVGGPSFVVYAI
jgi:hypothetical protein